MRHWNSGRDLLSYTVLLVLVFSLALVGCNDTSGNTATVNGTVSLTATNAAALGGLTFDFPDATLFGFPGQSTALALGADGTTFTLTTNGGTVIIGTITFGSCRLTQNPVPLGGGTAPFEMVYDTCEVTGRSDRDIAFGGANTGTGTLRLGRANGTPVDSAPEHVVYSIDLGGHITINENTTPIGTVG